MLDMLEGCPGISSSFLTVPWFYQTHIHNDVGSASIEDITTIVAMLERRTLSVNKKLGSNGSYQKRHTHRKRANVLHACVPPTAAAATPPYIDRVDASCVLQIAVFAQPTFECMDRHD